MKDKDWPSRQTSGIADRFAGVINEETDAYKTGRYGDKTATAELES